MAELLLELFSEEIPARMQARAADDLKRLVTEKLKEAGLAFTRAEAYATPRRLALVVDGLPLAQPDVTEEKRGPRVGAPEQAVQGFLKAAGLTSLDQCEKRDTGKGEFWFAVVRKKGVTTAEILSRIVGDAIIALPWPKSMRWSNYSLRWVRPLHRLLALFDGKIVDVPIKLGKIKATDSIMGEVSADLFLECVNYTAGHRFLAPQFTFPGHFVDYKAKLRESRVILDPAERRAAIREQAQQLAKDAGLTVKPDEALLDEVTGLVEWPVVLMGRIDDAFMQIPPEVLTTTMRTNQKYFSLLDKRGKLAPRFLVVSNMETTDGGRTIVAGNERVLRARLADAKFFWDQDRKVRLEDRVPALKDIVFHAKLGTMADKVARVQALAGEIAVHVKADKAQAQRAALLAKADLTSGMVGEFPELQGIMGRYYALNDGEPAAVADAIAEHYAPLGPNDRCPTAPVSIAAALADKIDTLVGFFAIDEKPTGSKDPFALRRAALGVIRLIVENNVRVALCDLVGLAYVGFLRDWSNQYQLFKYDGDEPNEQLIVFHVGSLQYEENGFDSLERMDLFVKHGPPRSQFDDEIALLGYKDSPTLLPIVGALESQLLDFFADRLKVALREKGVRHDLISAVFALGGEDDLVRLLARVDALKLLLASDDGANLLTAYRRASNIVRIEEKKDGKAYNGGADDSLLQQAEEKALHGALAAAGASSGRALGGEDFAGAMTALAELRRPVDAFFDKVTVNCDDPALRANRLRLLSQIRATLGQVADFSQIEG